MKKLKTAEIRVLKTIIAERKQQERKEKREEINNWKETIRAQINRMEFIGGTPRDYIGSYFIDQYRPTIAWPDGTEEGLGWASHIGGDAGGFKMLGFQGYRHFYRLPKGKRDSFLRKADAAFRRICGGLNIKMNNKDGGELESLYEELADKENKVRAEWKKLAKEVLGKRKKTETLLISY